MSNSISTELALVKELLNEGKFEEALQHVKDIEQKENLTPEEKLRTQAYKSWLHFTLGQLEITLKIAENLYQTSQEMKMPLFTLDAFSHKEWVFLRTSFQLQVGFSLNNQVVRKIHLGIGLNEGGNRKEK